ncbi:hypothetical protein AVU18_gp179 [Citrobacter phage IME-CF2]|jgi:hypothetical protein|uniref:Uncharacterized protein n=5 Tax=Pseudotevenvirus TaxID=2842979 RepID=A0A1B1IXP6_9CAUD|nr:hypothetical protein CPTMiller_00262 [Citrobacter phage Miller]YP_009218743.1 hypothetical protein AVU18_gp179 [Citrobacter phage IME-CF2]YP_009285796.1 hypothetical protein BI032_gp091 [Citrobacter phage vB_CfrM_CfP1]YP_239252.1 gp55.2 [Escherichia phage RB43]CCK74117.1 protein of unknown function [Pseudotevenvirus RB43]AAX78798.1 gp55.2 [Escherichia phage RB43]AIK68198.1 hypothetical protein CPTMiller_00262 [Citrobacter phage Miller]AKR16051.1 hypothetical protein [Citrobacter phage IME
MSREILLPAANAIHAETMEYMEKFVENDNTDIITPIHLDALENKLHKKIKDQFPEKVSRNFVRQEIVAMILKHYGIEMFGVKPIASKSNEISEKTIKKYAKKK